MIDAAYDVRRSVGCEQSIVVGVRVSIRELHLMWEFDQSYLIQPTNISKRAFFEATTYNWLVYLGLRGVDGEFWIAKKQSSLHVLSMLTIAFVVHWIEQKGHN